MRGGYEGAPKAQPPGLFFELEQQALSPLAAPVIRVRNDTGYFATAVLGERIERRAGDDPAIALQQAEAGNLSLQQFAGPFQQNAFVFQRFYQFENTADVLEVRSACLFVLVVGDQGAAAVMG